MGLFDEQNQRKERMRKCRIEQGAKRLLWDADYPVNRNRKANHRCRACWKIMRPGESARWLRKRTGKTWVIHEDCAKYHYNRGHDWAWAFKQWAVAESEHING